MLWKSEKITSVTSILGSLGNDDGDGDGDGNGNENGKKVIGLDSDKTTQLSTHITLFGRFLSRGCTTYNVKVPNFTFCRGRELKTTILFFFS